MVKASTIRNYFKVDDLNSTLLYPNKDNNGQAHRNFFLSGIKTYENLQTHRDQDNLNNHKESAKARRHQIYHVHETIVYNDVDTTLIQIGGNLKRESLFAPQVKHLININPAFDSASLQEFNASFTNKSTIPIHYFKARPRDLFTNHLETILEAI